jgi:hypothetical protein
MILIRALELFPDEYGSGDGFGCGYGNGFKNGHGYGNGKGVGFEWEVIMGDDYGSRYGYGFMELSDCYKDEDGVRYIEDNGLEVL